MENIENIMDEMSNYNSDSKTITGFFGFDEDIIDSKLDTIEKFIQDTNQRTDIMLKIDSISESKTEAIVLASMFFEGMGRALESQGDEGFGALGGFVTAMKLAAGTAIAVEEGIVDKEDGEKLLKIYSKVF